MMRRAWTVGAVLALAAVGADDRLLSIDRVKATDRGGPFSEQTPSTVGGADGHALQEAILGASYEVEPAASGPLEMVFTAPNREQDFASRFASSGIEINSSRSDATGWQLGLAVTRYGHAGDLEPLPAAPPFAEKERVRYRRGPVEEWYVNRPEGLEQGFELEPPARPRAEPIILEMEVRGSLRAIEAANGITFVDAEGAAVVRYSDLKAWDANGRRLDARLDAEGAQVRLVVDAQEAQFPVTVDPTFIHEARLLGRPDAIGRANAWVGQAIAVEGDTAIVGAPASVGNGELGVAYVFVRSGSTWLLQQKLRTQNPNSFDSENFGWSVALSGNTIVVGAPFDSTGVFLAGSAYVFVRSGTVWTAQQRLRAPDAAAGDRFGYSVSVSSNTIVVGADAGTYEQGGPGGAYAFIRTGSNWSLQQKLLAADPLAGAWLGNSVSLVGDTVVVGAPRALNPASVASGAAYVFARSGTVWSQQQKLYAADGKVADFFGASTSLSGTTTLIGAPYHGLNLGGGGAAYMFVRLGLTWSQEQQLLPPPGSVTLDFGRGVAIVGDLAVVGAPQDDSVAGTDTGSAYVFNRFGSTWTQSARLLDSGGATRDQLGYAVAASGGVVMVGAPAVDEGGAVDSGAVFVFASSGGVWQQQQKLAPGDEVAGDQLGFSVSLSGDTLVVGAPKDDTPLGTDTGSAYVYVRAGGVWAEQRKIYSPESAGSFGYSVAASGDTLLVGAPSHANYMGTVYCYVRSAGVWSLQQKLVGPVQYGRFGRSVALSGDTAVIGAYDDNQVSGDPGAAFVFVRSGSTWTHQQTLSASDAAANDAFGSSVALEGGTAVVGAPRAEISGAEDVGATYVFVRSGATWTQQRKLTASDGFRMANFGLGVSIAGNTVLVGAPFSRGDSGCAYVFVRSGTAWSEQQILVAPDALFLSQVGYAVSISGDRALLGAVGDAVKGSAYVFGRVGTTWTLTQKLLPPADPDEFGGFGFAVSMAGETAVIGDLQHTGAGSEGGSVDVFAVGYADLGVSKTDGLTQVPAGTSLTYQMVVTNDGPHAAIGAHVNDSIPPSLSCRTSCAGTGAARCGLGTLTPNIDDRIDIPPGQTVTYDSMCTVSPMASGLITNTVTVTAPSEVTDLTSSNNTATDIDMVLPAVSIEDVTAIRGAATAVFGVVLSEPHPSPVTVDFASHDGTGKAGVDYTAVAGTASFGVGQIATQVAVPLLPGGVGTKNFRVDLGNATNTQIGDGTGRGLIVDPGSLGFRPVTPCRVLDTRDSGLGGPLPLVAGESAIFSVVGHCGIPTSAKSVSANVTVVRPTDGGHLRVYPAGLPLPLVSVINYGPGQTRANSAVAILGAAGDVAIYVGQPSGSVDVILDVNGYFE